MSGEGRQFGGIIGMQKKPKVINHSFWITLFAWTLYYQARRTFVVLRSKVKLILNSYLCIINLFLNCCFTLKLILYYSKKRYLNLYKCFMHVYHWYWLRIFIDIDSIQLCIYYAFNILLQIVIFYTIYIRHMKLLPIDERWTLTGRVQLYF